MIISRSQSSYLLANYPALFEQVGNEREDILHGYWQEAFAGGNCGSGHSNSTARKALLLLKNRDIVELLTRVEKWIDNELLPRDSILLMTVCRLERFGWHKVARNIQRGVWECIQRWENMTNQLADYLNRNHCAGLVLDRHVLLV